MAATSGISLNTFSGQNRIGQKSRQVVTRVFLSNPNLSKLNVTAHLRSSRGAKVIRRAFERQSGSGAVMEKTRNFFVMPTPPSSAPKLDDSGNGGDNGKNIHNGGGGGGGGGDGDDDDYYQDGDDDGEGNNRYGAAGRFAAAFSLIRQLVPEQYDEFSMAAVFSEWMKTVADLPVVVRQAVQLGALSSAQLVRFLSMDVRPNAIRTATRVLPPELSRGLVGRLMADPAFIQKLFFETLLAGVSTFAYEARLRGEHLREELDVALTNTATASAAAFASVWLIAPTRNFGVVQYSGWRQALDSLPNNVFDVGSPLVPFSLSSRVAGFLVKAAELSAVGLLSGTVSSLVGSGLVALRKPQSPEAAAAVAAAKRGASEPSSKTTAGRRERRSKGGGGKHGKGPSSRRKTEATSSAVAAAAAVAEGDKQHQATSQIATPEHIIANMGGGGVRLDSNSSAAATASPVLLSSSSDSRLNSNSVVTANSDSTIGGAGGAGSSSHLNADNSNGASTSVMADDPHNSSSLRNTHNSAAVAAVTSPSPLSHRVSSSSTPTSLSSSSSPSPLPRTRVPVPDATLSSAGLAAYYGLSANLRYQLIGGAEQFLFGHSRHLSFYMAVSALLRVANAQVSETHRPLCQGLPQLPLPSVEEIVGHVADAAAGLPSWKKMARKARIALTPDLTELNEMTNIIKQSISSVSSAAQHMGGGRSMAHGLV